MGYLDSILKANGLQARHRAVPLDQSDGAAMVPFSMKTFMRTGTRARAPYPCLPCRHLTAGGAGSENRKTS